MTLDPHRMSDRDSLGRLQQLLSELFQLDQAADLDFGIYRLFRIKRDEIHAFIYEQLPRAVGEAFGDAAAAQRAQLEARLGDVRRGLEEQFPDHAVIGDDGSVIDAIRSERARAIQDLVGDHDEARAAIESIEASDAQKIEVFNHLHAFFSRYYDDGDFVPHRRYGTREHYAVPYNGEETYFHWANRGQHYVKSAEVFKDYAFTVEGDLLGGARRVRFVLAAASVPPGDTKGDARFFFPRADAVQWNADPGELSVPFEYRRATDAEIQRHGKRHFQQAVIDAAVPALLHAVPDDGLRTGLARPVSDQDDAPTTLARHVHRFARRVTSDYFVHRDLQGFLERELEFYVKDQVLHLADLDGDLSARAATIRVFRRVAGDVATFLAQIEDVQKRLFEKRKFVLRADYLVLLKEVPREWWGEVVANAQQLDAWQALFKVSRDDVLAGDGGPNEAFLSERPTLVIDTALFDDEFRDRLLEQFEDLDDAIGGVLVHSENYQALRLLEPKYAGRVKCIYIDPPYNTGVRDFLYKDRLQHSSWLTMMDDRLRIGIRQLSSVGVLACSIDEYEVGRLRQLVPLVDSKLIATFVWKRRSSTGMRSDPVSVDHEYVLLCCPSGGSPELYGLSKGESGYPHEDERGKYASTDLTVGMTREQRPGQFYEIENPRTGRKFSANPDRVWRFFPDTMQEVIEAGLVIWPDEVDGAMTRPRYKTYFDPTQSTRPISSWIETATTNTNALEDEAEEWQRDLLFSGMNQEGGRVVDDLFGGKRGSYPKPVSLVKSFVRASTKSDDLVMDFFAGSGTTAHAVVELNREEKSKRRFLLVEHTNQFDGLLTPRVQKILYSGSWRDGLPRFESVTSGTRGICKMLRLESYEDALHNTASPATAAREANRAAAHRDAVGADTYRLRYLARLPMEASDTMLSLEKLEHPFDYTLETLTDEGPVARRVDLVETFNLCLGLHVQRLTWWTNDADGGRRYRVVTGLDRDDRRTLVLWRDMDGVDAAVERAFLESKLDEADPSFDRALINGDSGCPRVESLDPLFKRLIEEEERP